MQKTYAVGLSKVECRGRGEGIRAGAPGGIRTHNRLIRRRISSESVRSIPYRWGA
jgi:hypothetical protein